MRWLLALLAIFICPQCMSTSPGMHLHICIILQVPVAAALLLPLLQPLLNLLFLVLLLIVVSLPRRSQGSVLRFGWHRLRHPTHTSGVICGGCAEPWRGRDSLGGQGGGTTPAWKYLDVCALAQWCESSWHPGKTGAFIPPVLYRLVLCKVDLLTHGAGLL